MFGLSLSIILSLFAVGLLVGAVSPTFGIGGGLLTVPILIMFYGFDANTATATSLGLIIFTTVSGTLGYIKEKRVDFSLAYIFMIFAIPGSILGAVLSIWLKGQESNLDILQVIFAGFMLLVAGSKLVSLLFPAKGSNEVFLKEGAPDEQEENQPWWKTNRLKRDFIDRGNNHFVYTVKIFPQIFIASIGGLVGSLLGLGGGIIYVPVLTMFMGVPIGIATATSTFTIFVSNFFPVFLRFSSIQWDYVVFLSLGTIISAGLVPRYVSRVKSQWILTGFWALVIVASVRLIANVLGF